MARATRGGGRVSAADGQRWRGGYQVVLSQLLVQEAPGRGCHVLSVLHVVSEVMLGVPFSLGCDGGAGWKINK